MSVGSAQLQLQLAQGQRQRPDLPLSRVPNAIGCHRMIRSWVIIVDPLVWAPSMISPRLSRPRGVADSERAVADPATRAADEPRAAPNAAREALQRCLAAAQPCARLRRIFRQNLNAPSTRWLSRGCA
eukprot:354141-Chlamydomonas_euryale.AAC.4